MLNAKIFKTLDENAHIRFFVVCYIRRAEKEEAAQEKRKSNQEGDVQKKRRQLRERAIRGEENKDERTKCCHI